MARPKKSAIALSKSKIFQTALALLDTHGEPALTFRALAKSLDVSHMAIAYHVGSRENLLTSLTQQVYSGVDIIIDEPDPIVRTKTLLQRYSDRIIAHPNLTLTLLKSPHLISDPLKSLTSQIETALLDLTADPKIVQTLRNILIDYTHGFALSVAAAPKSSKIDHLSMQKEYLDGLHWILTKTKSEAP